MRGLAGKLGRCLLRVAQEQQQALLLPNCGQLQHVTLSGVAACHTASSSAPSPAGLSRLHTAVLPQPAATAQVWSSFSNVDPFAPVLSEVQAISERLRHSVSSSIPALTQAAEYFFRKGVEGKRLRPTLTMLMASALSHGSPSLEYSKMDVRPAAEHAPELRRRQQRIAEIAELIHVASLLHDDVIDDASTRRGILSLNATVGNKVAILAGDFLLARASVSLAALRNTQIVELLSQVLEHLVSGEIMQMTASDEKLLSMEHYLQKTYCKTASLMANSAKAVAVLSDQPPEVCDMAWSYGRHVGIAFQVVDDILDLTASSSILGKPALNDIKSGLATAPVLFAAEQKPELRPLILRKFKQEGDLSKAVQLIEASDGIQRAKDLARHHCDMAVGMVAAMPEPQSDHAVLSRQALVEMTRRVLSRKK
uniref:Geranylgeranyl pyrophosphate synthase GGPPS2-2 n=1 Tax=Haematococcus lacustris TaxID=44745 RepID=A0A6B9QIN9_HAELA|nr:geranylgeranyl pyrophosphate synthase GGPPS2-2 [Haematococcus lacustris]